MSFRDPLPLLIGALGCAIAVLWPSATPGLGTIESAAPSYGAAPEILKQVTESSGDMVALHRQARLALAQLQTQAGGAR